MFARVTRFRAQPAVRSTVQARSFGHGYPPSVTGIARTTNFGHFDSLHFEDLLAETPVVAKALERIPGERLSDRDDRLKEALVLHAAGNVLPKERWATAAEDKAYLAPYLVEANQERRDREAFRPR